MSFRTHLRNAVTLGLIAAGLFTTACKEKTAAAPPPPEVGVVVMQEERVVLTTELPGPDLGLPGRRDPAAGQRHHPAAPVHGGRRRPGRRAPLPDRPGAVPGRLRPGRRRRSPWPRPTSRPPARAPSGCKGWSRSTRSASRTATTPPRPCAQAEAERGWRPAPRWRAPASTSPTPRSRHRSRAGSAGRTSPSGALVTAYQPVPLAVIQQLDPIYVDVTQSSADLLRLRRGLDSGRLDRTSETAAQGEAAPRGRHTLPARRHARVPRRDRGPDHRLGHPAPGLPQPRPRPPARHVRAGGGRGGHRRHGRSSSRSRG